MASSTMIAHASAPAAVAAMEGHEKGSAIDGDDDAGAAAQPEDHCGPDGEEES
jgi:hypothetical protein